MERRQSPRNGRPLVLVVEDHEDTASLYATVLGYFGFDAIAATRAEDGFNLAVERCPDVMSVDVGLPGMDGLQLLAHLKADERVKDIPVVCVTGYVQSSVRERAMKAGCAVFLEKPCPPLQLADALRMALYRKHSVG
jgi:CheY-like chemotaxis protein